LKRRAVLDKEIQDSELKELERKIEELENANADLQSYVDDLEEDLSNCRYDRDNAEKKLEEKEEELEDAQRRIEELEEITENNSEAISALEDALYYTSSFISFLIDCVRENQRKDVLYELVQLLMNLRDKSHSIDTTVLEKNLNYLVDELLLK